MRFTILSLFPESYFRSAFGVSILKRAQEKGLIEIGCTDIRAFAEGKHQRVDDRPYGGGPGMVMMPGPVVSAIRSVKDEGAHVVFLTPQGRPLKAADCERLAKVPHLILLCGHYEGIDERAMKEVDEEISIGDFVLTNGCVPALVLVDAVSRFVPGVLGHPDAAAEDSFQAEGGFDAPHYTRPEEFEGEVVPAVLAGGNHREIAAWRKSKSLEKTRRQRPELVDN